MNTAERRIFSIQRAGERAHFDFGWLSTYHSFSFADYFDPDNLNWGALRVFNDDTVQPGKGFGTHPHRDMEIVTYVLRGQLEHRDSMGNHGVVDPGGIQYMSAGTGVTHSEFNHNPDASIHFVQMWVLPRSLGEPPAYGQHQFTQADRTDRWLLVASGRPQLPAPVALRQDASLHVARLQSTALDLALETGRFGFLFAAEGHVDVDGEHLHAGDAVRLAGEQTLHLSGHGELVFWNVPPTDVRLEDA